MIIIIISRYSYGFHYLRPTISEKSKPYAIVFSEPPSLDAIDRGYKNHHELYQITKSTSLARFQQLQ